MLRGKKPNTQRHFVTDVALAIKIKNQCGSKQLASCQLTVSGVTPKCAEYEIKQLHPTAKVSRQEDTVTIPCCW